ncbi:DUF2919 domain-containing protein [Agaribacter flavus]|uniref:DUF2919 domain-containing protein n=1 Tax=Agaribacter flavus TaxID=1902781 RepID=A0ABV7FP71_9ALTE
MQLEFPLSHYDEGGRLKPPLFLYFVLLFFCRGIVIFVVALSVPNDSSRMMEIFYPEKYDFYLSLMSAVPAVLALVLLSRRYSIWQQSKQRLFSFLFALLVMASLIDLSLQIYIVNKLSYSFSISRALTLGGAVLALSYVLKSKHIRHLRKDWSKPLK